MPVDAADSDIPSVISVNTLFGSIDKGPDVGRIAEEEMV